MHITPGSAAAHESPRRLNIAEASDHPAAPSPAYSMDTTSLSHPPEYYQNLQAPTRKPVGEQNPAASSSAISTQRSVQKRVGPRGGIYYDQHPFPKLPVELRKEIYSYLSLRDQQHAIKVFEQEGISNPRIQKLLDRDVRLAFCSPLFAKYPIKYPRIISVVHDNDDEIPSYRYRQSRRALNDEEFYLAVREFELEGKHPNTGIIAKLLQARGPNPSILSETHRLICSTELSKPEPNPAILMEFLKARPSDRPLDLPTVHDTHIAIRDAELAKNADRNPDIFTALLDMTWVHRELMKATHRAICASELARERPSPEIITALLHQAYHCDLSIRDRTHVAIRNAELSKTDPDPDVLMALLKPRRPPRSFPNPWPPNGSIISATHVAIRDAELARPHPNPDVIRALVEVPPPYWPIALSLVDETNTAFLKAEIRKKADRNPNIFMTLLDGGWSRDILKATHISIRDAELAIAHPDSDVLAGLIHQAYFHGFSFRDETYITIRDAELARLHPNPDVFKALLERRSLTSIQRSPATISLINETYKLIRDTEFAKPTPNSNILMALLKALPPDATPHPPPSLSHHLPPPPRSYHFIPPPSTPPPGATPYPPPPLGAALYFPPFPPNDPPGLA